MRFSILIPAYKQAFLHDCLESVLSQDYEDYEVIVLNDASPENLESVVEQYFDNPKLKYYKNDCNKGAINLVDNWNRCLQLAEGDFVICIGDDDKLLPCCLCEYDKLISQFPGIAVYHGWAEIIDENGQFVDYQMPRPLFESAYTMMMQVWREGGGRQWIGDFCFNTRILREQGGFYPLPLAWGSDRITAVRAAAIAGIANTQKPVFQYRMTPFRLSSSNYAFVKIDARRQATRWYEVFLSHTAENEVDDKMRLLAQWTLHSAMRSASIDNIVEDMLANGFFSKLLFWWRRHREYDLTTRDMLKASILYLKFKFF
ncbi:MAG: glycosyltransferase family 2 protein [Bacteroidaceae bacterium]|nr:glycosyltransferase family 2 protein [Bacteroidaceae bacterium]